ncbi:hypothetical protein RCOM_0137680 [Ricinus communis]|uniref:Dof zinc finger protein n=2 Tax=Ricinus communis TaxID=3988 RepID=B9SJH7_RICCO|nr:hypothetical protein RCOM_0137680 [Ricinus communis]
MLQCSARPLPMEGKWKTHVELAPSCPRCASSNTKFCYYNNYSLSQPRYFCKGCRRYWTKGGSLRNVPVGGGCRKSRRAKSSRGAVSMNYGKNFNGPLSGSSCSSNMDSTVQETGSNNDGSEIDLAVVFAKFLNQESSFQPEFVGKELPDEPSDQELVSVANSLSPPDSDAVIECQNLIGESIQESNDLLQALLVAGNQDQEQGDQEMIMESQDMNEFGLQTLLGDEIVQDALWSEAETSLSNVTWQIPVDQVQPQGFDSFSVDDQLKIPTNLINDNAWSSFDLSAGFEVFSRSY